MISLALATALLLSGEDALPRTLTTSDAEEGKWRIDVALYLWAADLEGDFTIRGVSAEADADFSDLFDHLKVAGTLHVEAWRKNRIGILTDINYMSFEDKNDLGAGPLEATVTSSVLMTEVAAAFRLDEEDAFFDIIVGVRLIALDNEVEITGTPKESEAHAFLDPLVGLRVGVELVPWLLVTLRVDVGGFGVGTDMEGSLTALAAFKISPAFAILVGYREMAIEVSDDDSSVNLRMAGPLLAVDIGF